MWEEKERETMNGVNPGAGDELAWLMSLALDDEIGAADEARLNALLIAEPGCDEQWQVWQAVDAELHAVPVVLPPVDFVAKFEQRLAIQERRRQLRTGAMFGVLAVFLWSSVLLSVVAVGVSVWANQGIWMGGAIGTVTDWGAALGQLWVGLATAATALLTAPETRILAGGYVALAFAILTGWFLALRRSLQLQPLTQGMTDQ